MRLSFADICEELGDDHTRRLAVSLLYRQCGSVAEDIWDTNPIVAFILDALGIPPGSRASVKNVMRDVQVFEKDYDPNHNAKKHGKNGLICDYDGSTNIYLQILGSWYWSCSNDNHC